ncbi:phenazine biosynthesis protein PhzF family [Natronoarchaeum philippinense]|uniref:Phenazine biosynthesis protein PhzF family n=1 Tax=Natronoarchaeum philippinense TaxID=558529 RepID=A0A285NV63_NATPI|nr:PhzF family phenazine biosynthesis protein [Natronoarchaeum philippinense]SNZ13355.1 phenazine biosynthesis protein PhzF family [Natronoarchaeum philippinense]
MSDASEIEVALVDAFTDEPLTGNPAGVVPDAEGLSEDQMQAIASELSVSETAFLLPSGSADRRVRYFTPSAEVDLCGHATIGSHVYLGERGVLPPGEHELETNVGVLDIEVTDEGVVWMRQDSPTVRNVDLDYDRVADALGIDGVALRELERDLPFAVASTGLPVLVVPATYLRQVTNADPDQAAIEALCDEVGAAGLYLFTFDALAPDATLHGRMFAPSVGIPEDPVTGTAAGATGAYLRQTGAFGSDLPEEMRFEQGHVLDRPGEMRVRVGDEIRVGGTGVTSMEGRLTVPEIEEDEIVEA